MTSVPTGKCGPCCSVAATGRTAIHRAGLPSAKSGQWMSVQSRGGTAEVIERDISFSRFVFQQICLSANLQGSLLAGEDVATSGASYHGAKRSTESNHEP